jgi:hypothetical protein
LDDLGWLLLSHDIPGGFLDGFSVVDFFSSDSLSAFTDQGLTKITGGVFRRERLRKILTEARAKDAATVRFFRCDSFIERIRQKKTGESAWGESSDESF